MHSFNTVNRILVGSGCTAEVGEQLQAVYSGSVAQDPNVARPKHALLVSDTHLEALGLLQPALDSLASRGIATTLFTNVVPDPPEQLALECADIARREKVDAVIAIGGGSSMDLAKVVAVLAHPDCRQTIQALYGVDQVQGSRLPLLLAPSTAGTGSEVTPIAIITTGDTTKAGIVSAQLYADVALLDPALTASLPPEICAVTAVDAMVHAIEAYTSRLRKNPVSDQLARGALDLLSANIEIACRGNASEKVRENMLLGAMQAGQAFANAPVAAIHALAYPLGGHFHLSHGLTNALMMLPVMQFNVSACAALYAELAAHLGLVPAASGEVAAADALIDYVAGLLGRLELPLQLRAHGVAADFVPTLAGDAMQQTRLLVNNPRAVQEQDALALYRQAW